MKNDKEVNMVIRPGFRFCDSCFFCLFGEKEYAGEGVMVWCKRFGDVMCGSRAVCDDFKKEKDVD
jgi:hypothetical protein